MVYLIGLFRPGPQQDLVRPKEVAIDNGSVTYPEKLPQRLTNEKTSG